MMKAKAIIALVTNNKLGRQTDLPHYRDEGDSRSTTLTHPFQVVHRRRQRYVVDGQFKSELMLIPGLTESSDRIPGFREI
jgi:hypothetical protein